MSQPFLLLADTAPFPRFPNADTSVLSMSSYGSGLYTMILDDSYSYS
jgi:hypothetical protein